ncbi:energy transducer TonB [Parabacteroides sp. FAFU027]|uniref:energy transducer TonB n=1 Tax=Parabacteroides sp. FAFU027 TaxID=2922715 RepID=UPI001FB02978|nr:energy transducer TonB [Parabacteroides sp. FAFU027]
MTPSSKYHFLCFTFRLLTYFADRTNGAALFVRPKLMVGSIILSLGLVLPEKAVAQKPYEDEKTPPAQTVVPDSGMIKEEIMPTCYMVDMPEYPGGIDSMMMFLSKNMVYPKEAIEKKIEGLVINNFFVDKSGLISDVQIIKGVHPLLNEEAVRVIKSFPRWKWNKDSKDISPLRFTLPIRFTIPKETYKSSTPTNSKTQKNSVVLSDTVIYKKDSTISDNNDIPEPILIFESMPEFPKGNEAMMDYIHEHIIYPKELLDSNIKGTVLCEFLVSKEGVISDIKIVRGLDPLLDEEAVRIIKTFPKWKPGMQGGKAVPVKYTLPIRFTPPHKKK